VAYVGTIGITNALDTFLTCAEAMQNDSHIHFLMVGQGDLREHYQKKYGHLPNLTIAPRVPKPMVPSVLERCHLLYFSVHTSAVWKYGQSLNKVIDYMLSGKPIVASYTGYPSMIDEAECGAYLPAGDVPALKQALLRYAGMDSDERKAIGERGRDWIMRHRRYENLASQYLAVLFPRANL
jgi:glycosyltransferase involved in cell wall biosynthesis